MSKMSGKVYMKNFSCVSVRIETSSRKMILTFSRITKKSRKIQPSKKHSCSAFDDLKANKRVSTRIPSNSFSNLSLSAQSDFREKASDQRKINIPKNNECLSGKKIESICSSARIKISFRCNKERTIKIFNFNKQQFAVSS